MLRVIYLLLSLQGILFLFFCSANHSEKVIIKIGHSLPPKHPVHLAILEAKKYIAKGTHDSLLLDVFHSGVLGGERQMIEQLQLGTLDFVKVGFSLLEGFSPIAGVLTLPYLFEDEAHYWKVLKGPIGKTLLQCLLDKGVKGICYFEAGSRCFYTRNKPIYSPEDLSGLKVRVMESSVMIDAMQTLGASPTPISFGELYSALSQGVVDAAENNIPSLYTSQQFEVVKYYVLDHHTRVPDIVLVGLNSWEKIKPEWQIIIEEAFDHAQNFQRRLWEKKCSEYLKIMKERGLTIIEPSLGPFVEKVKPLYKRLEGTPIGKMAKRIKAQL